MSELFRGAAAPVVSDRVPTVQDVIREDAGAADRTDHSRRGPSSTVDHVGTGRSRTKHWYASDVVVLQPVTRAGAGWRAVTRVALTGQEPVFDGHFPGFPIFPGVCVVECVRHSARMGAPEPVGDVDEVESARFFAAVRPGEKLTIELVWLRDNDCWSCKAAVSAGGRKVAGVRLRFGK